MDWLNRILSDPLLLSAIIGLALVLFKDKPIIRQILTALLSAITPKPVPPVPPPVVLPVPVPADTHSVSEAIAHYEALRKCCCRSPEACEALKALWPHLEPGGPVVPRV